MRGFQQQEADDDGIDDDLAKEYCYFNNSLRHDDALFLWSHWTTPLDKALLKREYQQWFDYDKPAKWENNPIAIKIIDNIAIVFYSQKYSGNILSGSSRIMETWIKQDNKWLILGSINASCDKLPPCQ